MKVKTKKEEVGRLNWKYGAGKSQFQPSSLDPWKDWKSLLPFALARLSRVERQTNDGQRYGEREREEREKYDWQYTM